MREATNGQRPCERIHTVGAEAGSGGEAVRVQVVVWARRVILADMRRAVREFGLRRTVGTRPPSSTSTRRLGRRVALTWVLLGVGATLPGAAMAAAAPSVSVPGTFPLSAPAIGEVTLAHVSFTVRPRSGVALPKTLAGHVYLAANGGLTDSTVRTGAATPVRAANTYRYDAFLALIERSGSPAPWGPVVFEFGIAGASATQILVSKLSFVSAADAVGVPVAGSFCQAIGGDVAHPSVVAYLDARKGDPALGSPQRLMLARATAALCNGGQGAAKQVDALLAPLGAGGIGTVASATTTTVGTNTVTTTPAAQAPGFTPTTLAGTWTGTWTNNTFNTNGTLTLTITAAGSSLAFAETLTGNTFGCTTPAPQTFTLTEGSGANHWNAGGFTIAQSSQAFGAFSIAYTYPSGMLSGGGENPACAPGLEWSLNGGFTTTAFTAQIAITLPTGPANSTVSLMRGLTEPSHRAIG